MKTERPDISFRAPDVGERTLIMYPPPPRPPTPTFDPISSTLRLPFAPPRPTDSLVPPALLSPPPAPAAAEARPSTASVPAIETEVDPLEMEVALARLRSGRAPWALLGAIGMAAVIIAGFALFGHRTPTSRAAASGGAAMTAAPTSRESALERERALRASRAAGQWVETPEGARAAAGTQGQTPCDPSKPLAPGAPPCPQPPPSPSP